MRGFSPNGSGAWTSRCPWQHMDSGQLTAFCVQNSKPALEGKRLEDCRYGACGQCGVCDFEEIHPRVFDDAPAPKAVQAIECVDATSVERELVWTKMGPARFFGHLEMIKMFAAAFRRAGIKLLYSHGFHPMPQISFDNPLPLGMESQAERMWVKPAGDYPCSDLIERLNPQLPEGIRVVTCCIVTTRKEKFRAEVDAYHLYIDRNAIDSGRLDRFLASDQWPYERINRKGQTQIIDLKACFQRVAFIDDHILYVAAKRMKPYIIRPTVLLQEVAVAFGKRGAASESGKIGGCTGRAQQLTLGSISGSFIKKYINLDGYDKQKDYYKRHAT